MTNAFRPETIPTVWAETARRYADRIAFSEGGKTFTWGDLHRSAVDFAAGLVALGVERGDRVAIIAENSVDWVAACVGIMAAGAAIVPIYPELKPVEATAQLDRADPRLVLASAAAMASLASVLQEVEGLIFLGDEASSSPGGAAAMTFTSVAALGTPESRVNLASRSPAPDDLAAIVFTSGTTGGAKGVMLSHRNLVINGYSVLGALDLSATDSVLVVLPLHHAMPLIATIVLVPMIGAKAVIENDLRRIRERLATEKPTIFFGVPALYEVIYRNVLARAEGEGRLATLEGWQRRVRWLKKFTGLNIGPLVFHAVHKALGGKLRFLVSGGAALKPETAAGFFSLGLPLLQGWGMTEASPVVAIQPFSARRFRFSRYYEDHAGSVGTAVPGVEVKLVDVPEKGISVAHGGEGEVLVRGPNVFKGYWRAPAETAAAMDGEWLRTGDLARIAADGSIYLTGRSKYIIVLDSGEKVYPDEVEERLGASPILADVCVVGRTARERTQVAAIVYPDPEKTLASLAAAGIAPSEQTVREMVEREVARIGRDLAAYKRISQVILRDTPLPRTVLQKVARGQLEPDAAFIFDRWLDSGSAES